METPGDNNDSLINIYAQLQQLTLQNQELTKRKVSDSETMQKDSLCSDPRNSDMNLEGFST